jgi:hypothetical protein
MAIGGEPMAVNISQVQTDKLDALRQGRELLLRQIKESQETIERSRVLLKWMDDLLANAEQK